LASTRTLDEWLDLAQKARGTPFREEVRRRWRENFSRFYSDSREADASINEAGFVIRLVSSCSRSDWIMFLKISAQIEWLQRRLQRKWYIEAYGKAISVDKTVRPMTKRQGSSFLRPAIPASIAPPPVPSILPFHTVRCTFVTQAMSDVLHEFTTPLSVRTIRLISHRNALRVSHMALTKPWLPQHVYPPPPPPLKGRLNVGYISSDLKYVIFMYTNNSVFSHSPKQSSSSSSDAVGFWSPRQISIQHICLRYFSV
jgi:protein O-GlcNAc transferase